MAGLLVASALISILTTQCSAVDVGIVNVTGYKHVASYLNSSVYMVDLPPNTGYTNPPMLVHLTGSRQGKEAHFTHTHTSSHLTH